MCSKSFTSVLFYFRTILWFEPFEPHPSIFVFREPEQFLTKKWSSNWFPFNFYSCVFVKYSHHPVGGDWIQCFSNLMDDRTVGKCIPLAELIYTMFAFSSGTDWGHCALSAVCLQESQICSFTQTLSIWLWHRFWQRDQRFKVGMWTYTGNHVTNNMLLLLTLCFAVSF